MRLFNLGLYVLFEVFSTFDDNFKFFSRPPSRADSMSSCVSFRNRNNTGQRIKKTKRQRIKFHVYEPSLNATKRKDNCNNANNKNIMQNYENRMKQQQTLLFEVSFYF